jgi:hypothetical protein
MQPPTSTSPSRTSGLRAKALARKEKQLGLPAAGSFSAGAYAPAIRGELECY